MGQLRKCVKSDVFSEVRIDEALCVTAFAGNLFEEGSISTGDRYVVKVE